MKFLKCFVYFLTLIILGNFVLTGKEKVLPKPPTIKRAPKPMLPPWLSPQEDIRKSEPSIRRFLPPPPPPPKWSDFKYNSEEEKSFWDSVPSVGEGNFSKGGNGLVYLILPHYKRIGWRMDSMGGSIDKNSTKIGYSGFLKFMGSNTRSLAKFSNGIIDKMEMWDSNNQKICEYKDGVEKYWHYNGQIISESNYKDGKLEGLETKWKGNGHKIWESNYKDGKRDGLMTTWYENGQKNESNWKDGKLEGLETEWYENGQKSWERNNKDGKLDGVEKYWNQNGQISWESNYKDGKKQGLWVAWHPNGQKKSEINYNDGKVSGNAKFWTEDGKPKNNPAIRLPPGPPPRPIIRIPKKQEEQDQ